MIRKELKGKISIGFITMAVAFMLMGSLGMVTYASEVSEVPETVNTEEGVTPYSAIIEYRYKVIGSDVYRRLYNYTEQCWIGEWELCAEGFIKPGM